MPPRAEPAGGGGWPPCPRPLCSRLPASPAKKGPSEDKDDISKLVTGLMKTSICRQISYKTVEGNEVRAAPSPCAPLPGTAHGMVLTLCSPPPRPPPGPAAAPAPAPWRRWWRRPLTNPCPRPSGGRWPAAVKVSNTCPGHPTCPELPALPWLIAGPADSGAVIFPLQPLKTASPPLPSSSRPSGSCGPACPACPQVNQPGEGVEARVPLWEPQMEPQIPPDPAAGS